MEKSMLDGEVPMGLGMALAENLAAMERFAAMDDGEKRRFIAGAHGVRSKQEMKNYVNQIPPAAQL